MNSMGWARHLAWNLLAWCLGVALQLQQADLWPLATYVSVLMGVVACVGLLKSWRPSRTAFRTAQLLAWAGVWAAAAFCTTGLHAWTRAHTIAPALEGQDLDVVGVVQAMPQRQDLGWRFRFRIEQAWALDAQGAAKPLQLGTDLPPAGVFGLVRARWRA